MRNHSANFVDLSGRIFGKLKVIEYLETTKSGTAIYLCECKCGEKCKKTARDLRSGHVSSCGCLQKEIARKMHTEHGEAGNTRLYREWQGMKRRCRDKKYQGYKYYGGIGITVCEEWNEYKNFRDWALNNGYNDNLTLDRRDSNGNYCPENCHWITIAERQLNKRNNHFIEFNGERLTISQWERKLQMRQGTIKNRMKLGWDIERILTQPIGSVSGRTTV